MSELLTVCSLPGLLGGGLMEYGRLSRAEIIKRTREMAAHQKEIADAVLSAKDEAFVCCIVRGPLVQHLVEKLPP